MNCDLRDEVQRQIYFLGAYEPVETYVFLQLLKSGQTVIDAGANVGQYTLLASRAVGPTGAVYSFEPVPQTFARLQAHIVENRLMNIHAVRAALWSEPAHLRLGLTPAMSGNCGAFSIGVKSPATNVESLALKLDDFVAERAIHRLDLVKMDIEGAELFALRGMFSALRRFRPTLLMEVNQLASLRLGYCPVHLWDLLVGELGYRASAIGHGRQLCQELTSLDGIQQQNVLFHVDELSPALTGRWELKSILRWARSSVGNREACRLELAS